VKRFLVLAGAVLALIFGSAGIASAHADGPQVCNSGPQSACAKFYNDGDVVRVWDTDCDGHAAVAIVTAPGINDALWNTDGCGTYRDYGYGTSMPEGTHVYYRACYGISYSAGTWTRCSTTIGGGEA
jgi:hypothetical protein